MLFNVKNISIDPNKKTIIMYDKGDFHSYTPVYGTGRIFYEKLSKQYNIIFFTTRWQCASIKNQVVLDKKAVSKTCLRIAEDSNSKTKNLNIFYASLDELFKLLGISSIEYFIGICDTHFQLPLCPYVSFTKNRDFCERKNSFFDTVDENIENIKEIDLYCDKIVHNAENYVNILAFSNNAVYVGFFVPLYLRQRNMLKKKCIFFSIDPTLFTPFFIKNDIPAKFLYFAEDRRGTRHFEKFDIAQFQHIVYDSKNLPSMLQFNDAERKNLLFYGTIFQDKGPRKDIFYEFINDLNIEDSKFYIPFMKNKAYVNKNVYKQHVHRDLDTFGQLYKDVQNHPLIEKNRVLFPQEIPFELMSYKYNFIARCVSPEDSLNFRPVLSVLYDNLPFIDYMYDPCNLQIPKELNKDIVVKNSTDIANRIEYFNKNETERTEIVAFLRKHFSIDKYLESPDFMVEKEIRRIIPEFTSTSP